MRRGWGVVLGAVLAGSAACGADAEPELAPAASYLSPPGTPLAAGLVVPAGAELIGPVFPGVPGPTAPVTRRVAVLQIDDDPFAAWDDLAGQAQDIGVPVPSSGICTWHRSLPVPGLDAIPDVTRPVSVARPELADAVDCDAAASGRLPDGTGVRVAMRLWWWAAGAELHVEISEGDVDDHVSPYPATDPGPAPAAAAGQLPDRDPQVPVEVGDRFGRENNCFESGVDRLTLPEGARFVGGGTTPGVHQDFAAVLAVKDAEAVLGALRDQLDDPDNSGGSYGLREEERLADGTSVWALSGGVTAGGGGCHMRSSQDGTAVLVTTQSD